MTLDRRVRVLGRLLRRTTGPIATMSPRTREALRQRRAPGVVTDHLNGRRHPDVTVSDVEVAGPGGALPVRVLRPVTGGGRGALPLVVVFHGGGWMFGNVESVDWLSSHIAARVPAVVVSGSYRLAPEHPAPAAVDDAYTIARWAYEHSQELGASGRMAVLGESSGATLAASVALLARDRGSPELATQVLVYPITDLTLSSASLEELPCEPILGAADVRSYVAAWLDGRPAEQYSPLHAADLGGLPEALILGAAHDPLRDDARRYAARLRAAGVPVAHHELEGAPHGFFSFPTICRVARPALELLVVFLRRALLGE